MKRRINIWVFFTLCSLVWAAQPFNIHAEPIDPYIQGAQREGAVTLGVTLRGRQHGKPAGELYIDAFQKRYPFLKVTFKRIGGARERERIISEMTAGIINYDVGTVSETMVSTIVSAKLPRILEWEKLGVSKFLVHPDNVGVTLRTPVFGIGYNRDLIPDEVAGTFTWETCTDSKWKGKTAIDDRPRHLNRFFMDDAWGPEKTLDYAKRWAANQPAIEASRSTGASKLAAGAYHMICGMARQQVKELQIYGGTTSVGIVFPEPVPVGIGDLIYVPDKAMHPNAGTLFLVWAGSKEAQNLLDDVNFTGHPAFEGNDINKILKGKKVSYATWEDTARSDYALSEILMAMGVPVVRSKTKKKK
ncbi:MAG: hypothetical protein Q8P24_13815 [Desulfobacterales bacterium]|nr:hypothetical protein [Desulfobacterales bacterium]